jgi:hypothetical protein
MVGFCRVVVFGGAGRLDFNQACYDCQGTGCGHREWQGWREFAQLQLVPASLHHRNSTYVEEHLLILLRRMRYQACGSWKHIADCFNHVGQAVFNQVSSFQVPMGRRQGKTCGVTASSTHKVLVSRWALLTDGVVQHPEQKAIVGTATMP